METALVVDDERFFLTVLGDFVTLHLGMRPLLVQDGATALKLLETEQVDLVFLDIIMPEMDGLEILRRIKDLRPSLPVIMVTATSDIEHVIGALREGADDFVRKPVDLDELGLSVSRVLSKARVAGLPPPPPRDISNERRRAARVRMREQAMAQLQFRDVTLVDLSLAGALIEHTEPVRPGEIYRLSFVVGGKQVQVLARAIRVYASHRVTVAGGERQVVYRTGMEFVGVKKDAADLISTHVDHLLEQGKSKAQK
ncbi:MAG TPA: response regulator [Candidatus Methylomirabilis sp.]|nr:response regulator [Candidatus Methylomirabilis sp.]